MFLQAEKLPLPDDIERHLDSCIMHGERYDPTLEKLPKFFDPVIFWANYYPNRMHGTPLVTRGYFPNLFFIVVS